MILIKNKFFSFFVLLVSVTLFYYSYQNKNFILILIGILFLQFLFFILIKKTRNIIIFFSTITFSYLIIELFIIAYSNDVPYFDPSSDYVNKEYFVENKEIGYTLSPGVFKSKKIASDGNLIYDVKYVIDKSGFRKTKTNFNSTKNINFYGCSFTFGEGLNQSETLPYYFSELFPDYKINNFGVHGWGVNQAVNIIDEQSDSEINILLTYPEHSLRSSCKVLYSYDFPKYKIFNDSVKLIGNCESCFLKNDFLCRVFFKSKVFLFFYLRINRTYIVDEIDIELYFSLIDEFIKKSKAKNQQVLLGILPTHLNQYYDRFSKLNSIERVYVVDIRLLDYNNAKDSIYYLHKEDKHPSSLANKIRANIISDYIEKLQILKN